jgi:hypothetical protein
LFVHLNFSGIFATFSVARCFSSDALETLRKKFVQELKARFMTATWPREILASALLDMRGRSLAFASPADRENMWKALLVLAEREATLIDKERAGRKTKRLRESARGMSAEDIANGLLGARVSATSAAPPAVVTTVSVTATAAAAMSAVVAPSSSAMSSAVVQASTVPDPHPVSGPDAAGLSSSPDDAAGPSSFSGPSASAPTSASRKRAFSAVAAAAADRPRSAAEEAFTSRSMWRITLAPDNSSVGDDEVPAAAAKAEIDEFKKEEKLFRSDKEIDSFDPLLWWKDRQSKYPILSRLVRRILCIQATSAPSERIFSAAGQLLSKRRMRLAPSTVMQLLFLYCNRSRWRI